MKRSTILIWLERKKEYFEGQYMNAEDKDDDEKMLRLEEKINNIDEIIRLLLLI